MKLSRKAINHFVSGACKRPSLVRAIDTNFPDLNDNQGIPLRARGLRLGHTVTTLRR